MSNRRHNRLLNPQYTTNGPTIFTAIYSTHSATYTPAVNSTRIATIIPAIVSTFCLAFVASFDSSDNAAIDTAIDKPTGRLSVKPTTQPTAQPMTQPTSALPSTQPADLPHINRPPDHQSNQRRRRPQHPLDSPRLHHRACPRRCRRWGRSQNRRRSRLTVPPIGHVGLRLQSRPDSSRRITQCLD